jgi:hypothetical protein
VSVVCPASLLGQSVVVDHRPGASVLLDCAELPAAQRAL